MLSASSAPLQNHRAQVGKGRTAKAKEAAKQPTAGKSLATMSHDPDATECRGDWDDGSRLNTHQTRNAAKVQTIRHSSDASTIINDILDFSKIESGNRTETATFVSKCWRNHSGPAANAAEKALKLASLGSIRKSQARLWGMPDCAKS